MFEIVVHLESDTHGDTGDELRSLRRWLLSIADLRGRVTIREQPPEAGQMGPRLEALVLGLEGATARAAGSFADAVTAWAEAGPRQSCWLAIQALDR